MVVVINTGGNKRRDETEASKSDLALHAPARITASDNDVTTSSNERQITITTTSLI